MWNRFLPKPHPAHQTGPHHRLLHLLLLLGGLLLDAGAQAISPVEVVALFKDRAVVRTAHGQAMLKVGQTSKFGVTLLAADPHHAEVQYQGEVHQLVLSAKVSSTFSKPAERVVRLTGDSLGQYRMRGSINGQFVNFLVDTGASVVALSERHANGMGLDFESGRVGTVQTAQGVTEAYFIDLAEVVLGSIAVRNVQATVIKGDYPTDVLLGMSFLTKVRMQNEGGMLVLTARH